MGFVLVLWKGPPSRRNRSSAYERPNVISEYLVREVDSGRMATVPAAALPLLRTSPIPKKTGQTSGDLLWTCPPQTGRV